MNAASLRDDDSVELGELLGFLGDWFAAHHDPLVASVSTFAPTRHEAVLVLDRVIAETRVAPLVTNLRLLRRALNHESFRAQQVDEGFLDRP